MPSLHARRAGNVNQHVMKNDVQDFYLLRTSYVEEEMREGEKLFRPYDFLYSRLILNEWNNHR